MHSADRLPFDVDQKYAVDVKRNMVFEKLTPGRGGGDGRGLLTCLHLGDAASACAPNKVIRPEVHVNCIRSHPDAPCMPHLRVDDLPPGLLEKPDCPMFPSNRSAHSASGTPGGPKPAEEDNQADDEQRCRRTGYRPEGATFREGGDPLLPGNVQVAQFHVIPA